MFTLSLALIDLVVTLTLTTVVGVVALHYVSQISEAVLQLVNYKK